MTTILTLHDPATAAQYYEQGYWQHDTFYTLLRAHAERRPTAYFLRDARRRLTYAEALRWVDALAAKIARAGLRSGDRVAMSLPNRVEMPLIFLACSRNGYVCNPSMHQNFTTAEVVQLMQRMRTAALFTQSGYGVDGAAHERGEAARQQVETLRQVFRLEPGHVPGDAAADGEATLTQPSGNPDQIVYLAFTSGTTGIPKAVMHSDNTLLANARPMVADWGHDERTILMTLSPLSHHNGWVALGQVLVCGGELVVHDLPPGLRPFDWIVETGATYVMGVPTHAIDLLADIRSRGADRLGRVRSWYIAGATIPPEVSRGIVQLGINPQNVYGMTENSSHQYPLPSDDAETMTTTCGRANRGYEVRIFSRDDRNQELPAGSVGEIAGKGACLMLGYFDNQTATEESFNDAGWFMTGDLGVLDERGCLKIVGRVKDLIIRGGHNIFPSRIENLAITHPRIQKAAAFGVADERLGERVCLAVTTADDVELAGEEVLNHLHAAGLSRYDMPEFLVCLAEMPLTASGKILKRELVVMARDGRIQPQPVRWSAPAV